MVMIESIRGAVQLTNYRLRPDDFTPTADGMVARVTHHAHERWVGTQLYATGTGGSIHASIHCVDDATIEVTFCAVNGGPPVIDEDYILTVIA
jgi:hypothetical protein